MAAVLTGRTTRGRRLRRPRRPARPARRGKLVEVPGRLGDGSVPAADPALSPEGDQLAALSPDRGELYLTALTADAPVRSRLVEPDLTPPSWDPLGTVWTTSRTEAGSAVWAVRPGEAQARRVSAPELDDQQVVALRVARDGVRVAVILDEANSGRSLFLGRIERADDTLALGGLRRAESTLVDVADVAWADADRMAVLGQEPNGVLQPFLVEPDGEVQRAAGSLSDLVRIAAAPGRPLLAATDDGHLWLDTEVGWLEVGEATGPAYPG